MSGKGRFWDDSASEASDEGARESRSHKDKAWDALMSCCESIHNHLKINNWVALDEDYDKLQRTFEGAHILIAREVRRVLSAGGTVSRAHVHCDRDSVIPFNRLHLHVGLQGQNHFPSYNAQR